MPNRTTALLFASLLVSCGGELFLLDSQPQSNQMAALPCTVLNRVGECPGELVCCSGVCANDCSAWACACSAAQACVGGQCEEITPDNSCTLERPEGLCPLDFLCIGGSCVPVVLPCGDCEPNQACKGGECIDIPAFEACSAELPAGLCRDGEVCVGGICIGLDNGCSSQNLAGLCPPGATCVSGNCLPIDEKPCAPGVLDGRCPSCQECVAPGICKLLPCSPGAPHCACSGADEYCHGGTCECLPCSPTHLAGCCNSGAFCSVAGKCIDEGTCADAGDCSFPGTFCGCGNLCMIQGTCQCDSDCEEFYVCDTSSPVCVRDLDCPGGDSDCPEEEFCDAAAHCRPDGTCGAQVDCDSELGSGYFCSSCAECIPVGMCCSADDCTGDEFCSSANRCLEPGACDDNSDCRPGDVCNPDRECERGNATCSTNGPASCVRTGTDYFWCCEDPAQCCLQGQRCSAADTCIGDGECIDDSDCYTPYFTCVDWECAPVTECSDDDCSTGLTCSQAGGCIPDDGTCVHDGDCPSGEVCNALFACEPATGCANQQFEATLVPPNMLLVLDRSSSMADCVDSTGESRWNVARDALTSVIHANSDSIRFGLSTYPAYCPESTVCAIDSCNTGRDNSCSHKCDWDEVCDDTPEQMCNVYPPCTWDGGNCVPADTEIASGLNRVPGDVDVPVGDAPVDVLTSLEPPTENRGPQHPGGATPTGRTLRNIASQLSAFGLADSALARDNFIMLVTDGDANNPGGTYGVCDEESPGVPFPDDEAMPPIECALDTLRSQEPPVRTFAVGFIGTAKAQMNCMAVHGGTSRCATPAECDAIDNAQACDDTLGCAWSASCSGGVDETNCDGATEVCYFNANNAAELNAAFLAIAGEIASCNYALNQVPVDDNFLFVYMYYQCDSRPMSKCASDGYCSWDDGACVGNPVRLDPDPINGWHYESGSNQIVFQGAACDLVTAREVTPVVILGCGTGEG